MSEGRPTIRGIDHIGITVPDIERATEFLVAAFGAEVLYDMAGRPASERNDEADRDSQARLGTRAGTRWAGSRMLRLANGPGIELFEYDDPQQRDPVQASDLGIQHFAVCVDDIDVARRRIIEAGGTAFEGPTLLPGPEAGENNKWLYTRAPWGSLIELTCLPSPQAYEELTPLRRWLPEEATETPAAVAASEE
jgi:catechol 2,3-dioxygenase-like lactoylglutathione lyase family enzyme